MDIKINSVSKSFDKKPVLTDISFDIESGGTVCLLGPSGSGKTTLIRLIIGAISADRGKITVGGVRVPNRELLSRVGFMPQNDALYDDLTGEDNLRFFAGLYKVPKNKVKERINDTLGLVDLSRDGKKLIKNYSGGMKKRLSLAAAILHEPDVILLDEPTVGIDPVLRRKIWARFADMSWRGKTLVVTTHVMDEAEQCDKAALIYNGRLIRYDTVGNLRKSTKTGGLDELFFDAAETGTGDVQC